LYGEQFKKKISETKRIKEKGGKIKVRRNTDRADQRTSRSLTLKKMGMLHGESNDPRQKTSIIMSNAKKGGGRTKKAPHANQNRI